MRKYTAWMLVILLLGCGLTGCRTSAKNHAAVSASPAAATARPSDPPAGNPTDAPADASASPDLPEASASPDAPTGADASPSAPTGADASPAAPDASPLPDASYREYEVVYPSRGVNVHATVVLPGSTGIAGGASASPDANAPSGSAPSGSPAASSEPVTGGAPSGSPAASPNGSAAPDESPLASPEANAGNAGRSAAGESPSPDKYAYGDTETGVMPISAPDATQPAHGWPLVVFLHGHGGERNENGGYRTIAHALAGYGIASIRMDFAGSGDSEEAFTENSLTSMYTDALSAIDFAKQTYPIDENAVGVFGFDMGGRVALHLLAEKMFDFRAAVLLAPANRNADFVTLFGGPAEWERYKTDAELNNYTTFTSPRGQRQDLSVQWFSDLDQSDNPAALIGDRMQSRALVIYATNDTTVSPDVSREVAELLGARTLLLESGGHSYGFYAENEALLNRIASAAAEFFAEALQYSPR